MNTYDQHVIDQVCWILSKRWGFDFNYLKSIYGGNHVT